MKTVVHLIVVVLLSSCAAIEHPVRPPVVSDSVRVMKSFPKNLPKGSSRFEETQLFFVHADQASELAVGLLVPIPFVTDMAVGAHKKGVITKVEKNYHALSAFEIAVDEINNSAHFKLADDGFNLYPIVFIEECMDGVYRLSLAYQLEKDTWMGRYYYHLPTHIPKSEIAEPPQILLDSLTREMHQGAETLIGVMHSDVNREYVSPLSTASVGSLYIVGSRIAGLTNPEILVYKDAEVLEESADALVLRISGQPQAEAKSGGMAFGIHYFRKDQLHTLKRQP